MPRGHGGRLRRLGSVAGACLIVSALALSIAPFGQMAAAQQSETRPSELLAACACRPTDESLFTVYNPEVTYPPVPDPGLSPAQVEARAREQLQTVIEARDPSLLPTAEAVFDDPALLGTVPHPSLRAGLAMLVGTFAEALIDVYRSPDMRVVRFGTPSSNPDAHAQLLSFPDGSQEVWFNPVAEHELPGQFTMMFAHEALHASGLVPGENGRPEEATLHLVGALVHAVMIRDQSQLALGRTRVGVDLATSVLGIVFNSRSMTTGRDPNVFPGAVFPGAVFPELDNLYEDAPYLRDVPELPSAGDDDFAAVLSSMGLADLAGNPAFDRDGDGAPDHSRPLVESLQLDRILDGGRVLSADDLRQVATTLTIRLATEPPVDGSPQTGTGSPGSVTASASPTTTTTAAATTVSVPVEVTTTTVPVNRGAVAAPVELVAAPSATAAGRSATGGSLARTGRNVGAGVLLALLLVVSGAAFVRASRSRRTDP